MMLCSANYVHSIVVSGCVKYPLKQVLTMPEIFFTIRQSAREVLLAALVLKASHRACVGMCKHVQNIHM